MLVLCYFCGNLTLLLTVPLSPRGMELAVSRKGGLAAARAAPLLGRAAVPQGFDATAGEGVCHQLRPPTVAE